VQHWSQLLSLRANYLRNVADMLEKQAKELSNLETKCSEMEQIMGGRW
jgi:acyl-CoA reductase-like NAD-dependent aldehyde dehydrogenase